MAEGGGADADWPDLAGRIVSGDGGGGSGDGGGEHVLAVRVYFEDTDFSGLVYHASYLRWCERGRSDFLRLLGVDHRRLIAPEGADEPAAFVIRRMEIDFLKPARIDEVLEVRTRCREVGAATLGLEQTITRDGSLLFRADVLAVLVSTAGKPLRLTRALKDALACT